MEDHMEFKKDIMGMPLNYKILVQNLEVQYILHNSGDTIDQVPFNEIKMKIGEKSGKF